MVCMTTEEDESEAAAFFSAVRQMANRGDPPAEMSVGGLSRLPRLVMGLPAGAWTQKGPSSKKPPAPAHGRVAKLLRQGLGSSPFTFYKIGICKECKSWKECSFRHII